MKAIINTSYGGPGVLELKEIPKPVPGDKEVLIKVHSATVNRTDCAFLKGTPLLTRLFSGLFRPKNQVLGNEFAGEIEAIGKEVTSFSIGDKVLGYNDKSFGAHAEYMLMNENGPVTTIPVNSSYGEAAAMTEGAHYALCNIRAAKIRPGQKVLVNGGTGGIGSAAIQLATYLGAEVTAVCDTNHLELVRSLGASNVIDYTREDFTKTSDTYDVVFDTVGKSSFGKCKPLLKEGGIYMSTELGYMSQNIFFALFTLLYGSKKLLFPIPSINKDDVTYLKELFEKGHYKPVIDRYYPLEEIAAAYTYVDAGKKTGNVIITIGNT